MKTEKQTKDLQPISVGRAKEILEKYFKDTHVVDMEVSYPGIGKMVVDVSYEDFKPAAIVRRELEELLPFAEVSVERDISFEQGKKMFFDAWSDCEEFDVLVEGRMKRISLRYLICKILEDKAL